MRLTRLIINTIILCSVILGIIATHITNNFMSNNSILYFTMQSNILVALISLIFIIYDILKHKIPNILYILKYIFTVAITLTFLVFNFILVPYMNIPNIYDLANILLHIISPICTILSFILDNNFKNKNNYYILGITFPLIYLIFTYILYFLPYNIFIDSKFPYFFLDFEKYGWFSIKNNSIGVIYYYIIILVMTLGISKILLILNNKGSNYVKKTI